MIKRKYDLHVNVAVMGIIQAADCVVVEDKGVLTDFGLRYREEFLAQPGAFSLDPNLLPLGERTFELSCAGGMPALSMTTCLMPGGGGYSHIWHFIVIGRSTTPIA